MLCTILKGALHTSSSEIGRNVKTELIIPLYMALRSALMLSAMFCMISSRFGPFLKNILNFASSRGKLRIRRVGSGIWGMGERAVSPSSDIKSPSICSLLIFHSHFYSLALPKKGGGVCKIDYVTTMLARSSTRWIRPYMVRV